MKLNKLYNFIATFFGIGYIPIAPGTWGSFFAIILWFLIPVQSVFIRILLIVIVFIIGLITSNKIVSNTTEKDPSRIVIDEVVGMWITLISVPSLAFPEDYFLIVIAFLLFRFFDISKIPPIKQLESLKDGLGIMADDVMAGVYAGFLFFLVVKFLL